MTQFDPHPGSDPSASGIVIGLKLNEKFLVLMLSMFASFGGGYAFSKQVDVRSTNQCPVEQNTLNGRQLPSNTKQQP